MYNQLKTVILLGLLTAVLLWVGQLLGGVSGLVFAIIIVAALNFGMYFFSDKIVLMTYRAKEAPHSHELYKIVQEVAHLARLPMPKVYIIPSEQPNAFATGRNPRHAAVAATEGILKILTRDELKGVMAHEMSHVKNRDTLIQTIAGTMAGIIGFTASMARWGAIFGGFGRDNNSNGLIELLVLAIVTPIMAVLIQLAISRSREYMADATAKKMLHSGDSLASALEKLEIASKKIPMRMGSPATENLFIVNPFSGRAFISLLSTHPPMNERIRRLRN